MFLSALAHTAAPTTANDDANARSTVSVTPDSEPASTAPHVVSEHLLPGDPETGGGLTSHTVGSPMAPRQKYAQLNTPGSAINDAIQREINDGQTTKGTAVARAENGQYGPGTLPIIVGIDPVITGAGMESRFFTAPQPPVGTTDGVVAPTFTDPIGAATAATATVAARNSMDAAYWAAMITR